MARDSPWILLEERTQNPKKQKIAVLCPIQLMHSAYSIKNSPHACTGEFCEKARLKTSEPDWKKRSCSWTKDEDLVERAFSGWLAGSLVRRRLKRKHPRGWIRRPMSSFWTNQSNNKKKHYHAKQWRTWHESVQNSIYLSPEIIRAFALRDLRRPIRSVLKLLRQG